MKLKSLFLIALASVGLTGTASATLVPATWTDTYDVDTAIYIGKGASYSYWHDITFDGFRAGIDKVTDFTLSIDLFDDEKRDSIELAFIDIGGSLLDLDNYVYDFGVNAFEGWSIAGRTELNKSGTLGVEIHSVCFIVCGDFNFGGSRLIANGKSDTTQVPEPSTLGMLGLGLLGVSLASRRRRVTKS